MNNIFDRMTEPKQLNEGTEISQEQYSNEVRLENFEVVDRVQYTPRQIKDASQELLRHGLLEMNLKPKLYQVAIGYENEISDILEPFDLSMRIDDIRGLAYLVLSDEIVNGDQDEWTHPLIRKQRLNLEQSLMLAILREFYIAHELENGIGSDNSIITIGELLPRIRIYLGEMGSEMAEEKRLRNLLDKLKGHGVVSDVDKYDQLTIRPIITHLANPENLINLLQVLRQKTSSTNEADIS
ncbi:hypothetical protein A9Q81_08285 [Gammaproteobacteria bacterium 42_54_T18]|nr:hypothetical protein A9Q81_08285 [Gammaproteobacteria bacterium 42_54_T18]